MSALSHLRRGWCPGALRPMESGDGAILRVRPHWGELTAIEVCALAAVAGECGNGIIELTRRAGVQLRGISATTLPEAHRVLDRLGFLDESPQAEVRRNILRNPLAGIDPDCRDIRPITDALEQRLAYVEACNRLPSKFGFVVDGGGRLPLRNEEGDIRFDVCSDNRVRVSVGGNATMASLLGWCCAGNVPEIAARLVSVFVEGRTADMTRMRTFVSANGTASLLSAVDGLLDGHRLEVLNVEPPKGFIGLDIAENKPAWFGAAWPFGSGDAVQWDGLAALSDRFSDGKIRITPWRSIILLLKPDAEVDTLLISAKELGLVTDADDPRRFLIACPGAPFCRSAHATTRDLANAIATAAPALMDGSVCVHVSGCVKSCARSGSAEITLTAYDGGYSLGFASSANNLNDSRPLSFDDVLSRLSTLANQFAQQTTSETAASFIVRLTRQKMDIR